MKNKFDLKFCKQASSILPSINPKSAIFLFYNPRQARRENGKLVKVALRVFLYECFLLYSRII